MLSAAHTVKLRLITISDHREIVTCVYVGSPDLEHLPLQLLNYYTSCGAIAIQGR
jgi:hypothetical protein